MVKRFLVIISIGLASIVMVSAQSVDSSTQSTRTRVVAPKPSPTPKTVTNPPTQKPAPPARSALRLQARWLHQAGYR